MLICGCSRFRQCTLFPLQSFLKCSSFPIFQATYADYIKSSFSCYISRFNLLLTSTSPWDASVCKFPFHNSVNLKVLSHGNLHGRSLPGRKSTTAADTRTLLSSGVFLHCICSSSLLVYRNYQIITH
jgi:hypothetical protein